MAHAKRPYAARVFPPDRNSAPVFKLIFGPTGDKLATNFRAVATPAVFFVTTDPAFFGEITIMVTFEEVCGGTKVTFLCKNLPPGLRAEDNEAGSRSSLEQLGRRFE